MAGGCSPSWLTRLPPLRGVCRIIPDFVCATIWAILDGHAVFAAGLKVCRLAAGGSRIRTASPFMGLPRSCLDGWRGSLQVLREVLVHLEHGYLVLAENLTQLVVS